MQLRRFTAEDISKALEKVKAELGEDAIILSTKKKRKKELDAKGFVSYTEVVAAVDRKDSFKRSTIPPPSPAGRSYQEPKNDQGPVSLTHLSDEIQEIKKALAHMSSMVQSLLEAGKNHGTVGKNQPSQPESTREIEKALKGLKLDPATFQTLSASILSSFSQHPVTSDQVASWLNNYIIKHFNPGPLAEEANEPVWWAFIGPTGVGKTTTLAKIAARLKFLKKRKGVLVSVDSYRLGAIDQLSRYARLMELPLEIARTNKDLLRIFGSHRDKDFILLDTTGRNPFSSSHRTELERIFDAVPGLMAQVMLCSTYKREDLMESIKFYKRFPAAGWTLTKTDETRSLAASLFPVIQAEIPLSYMTTGQRVPEDIIVPTGRKLSEKLLIPKDMAMDSASRGMTQVNANVC